MAGRERRHEERDEYVSALSIDESDPTLSPANDSPFSDDKLKT